MPSDGPDPTSTRADGTPETSRGNRGAEVAVHEPAPDGTVVQDKPPVWVQPLSGAHGSSGSGPSGQAFHELDREIERLQTDGGDIADGYALVRKLGSGSFGTVWEAVDRLTNERVAIKFFTAGASDWEKLLSEVGLLQAVEGCRGIVIVKQVRPGGDGRRPLYVMQLANGGSLAEWIKTAGAFPPRERARLATGFFTRVARAMAAVHRRGIHHCDLKPQNILLHSPEPGAEPEPLVADFGQGHLATDDTPALGTFFYMPPDQIDAAQVSTPPDTRWDVYALGAVAHELLTGSPPRRSPELAEKIKKAPKQLPAKMAVYREGVFAAPRPSAHHKLVDRQLGRIIDRCLSLNPDTRPRDAGALVALLDARARWRRTRPVLALAAAATLLVIGLIAGVGIALANAETDRMKGDVTAEVSSSLARTAGYGAPAIEDRLQRHIAQAERIAFERPPAVAAALDRLGRGTHGPTWNPGTAAPADFETCQKWLTVTQEDRLARLRRGDSAVPLRLVLVADSGTPGRSRGYFLVRAHPDGKIETHRNADTPAVFTHDFSYRDYFHARGHQTDEIGQPHAPVRATHISEPYRSTGDDRTADGQVLTRPWKVDVATPIWDNTEARRRVVGLLILGLNLERDLAPLLEPADLGATGSQRLGIGRRVKVVLIDHRDQWVWHPDCKQRLIEDRPDGLPHNYRALARTHGASADQTCPWDRVPAPAAGTGRRYGFAESADYIDFVEAERADAEANTDPEIACFTRFNPYAQSRYGEDDPTTEPGHPRKWVLVAQVDKRLALAPLTDLERKLVAIGAGAGGALVLLALVLWGWLVRVLRRLEFASHG
ncbi:serine/threonine protein kinase [Gemmata sp. G18]|uniref:Serine/threonine protein kinase n=1 Tax=Gemmata palustris TaxID=2822762 RepID=A0ABS5C3I3_9BACT|nr:serine/threonine-protein kinase [Gemmata palustris]MBP3960556.1 serine/threonine protein kinase [Gemmata palustris]